MWCVESWDHETGIFYGLGYLIFYYTPMCNNYIQNIYINYFTFSSSFSFSTSSVSYPYVFLFFIILFYVFFIFLSILHIFVCLPIFSILPNHLLCLTHPFSIGVSLLMMSYQNHYWNLTNSIIGFYFCLILCFCLKLYLWLFDVPLYSRIFVSILVILGCLINFDGFLSC